jgi:hypothetical protein
MERAGIDPNDRFFRVLLQKFESENAWREAIHLLHVIRKAGRANQVCSYTHTHIYIYIHTHIHSPTHPHTPSHDT